MVHHIRDDRVLPLTRLVGAVIVVVLLAAVWILYLQPDETTRLWAWTIRPRMTPLLMGSGYLAGAYFFVRVVIGSRWHEVSRQFLAITAFTWFMGAATILHWDRFNHDHISFFAWTALYFTTPIIVPAIWLYNRRTDPITPEPGEVIVPSGVRHAMTATGVLMLSLSLFLFLIPNNAIDLWPWTLSPLTARVIGGFFALPGVTAIALGRDLRWSAYRIMHETFALAFVLMLIGVARAWDDFDTANPMTWIYTGGLVFGLAAICALYLNMEARRRSQFTGAALT